MYNKWDAFLGEKKSLAVHYTVKKSKFKISASFSTEILRKEDRCGGELKILKKKQDGS